MPGCCVPNCGNRSEKGFRLFRIPQADKERNKLFLKFIDRSDLPVTARVCEAHFERNQFESNRQDGKRLLKWNAVPSIKSCKRKHEDNDIDNDLVTSALSKDPATSSATDPALDQHSQGDSTDSSEPSIPRENADHVDNLQFHLLHTKLKEANRQLKLLEKQKKELEEKYAKEVDDKYSTVFNPDQINFIKKGSHRGTEWSDETINKGLKLYMACGAKGYEEIRRQNLPFPSIRTLQHRIRHIKFEPGLLHEIFHLLQLQMETFEPHEKHAVLLLDEMAIRPVLQYNNSTNKVMGRPTMKLSGNKDSSNEIATHALVFMLAGIGSRWKQIIGYELTANSYSADEVVEKILSIIKKCHDIGITIKTVVSDMGPQNRAFWRIFNINAHRYGIISNFTQHPLNETEKLYVMPDPIHLLKNVARAFLQYKKLDMDADIVNKFNLPSNIVDVEDIKTVFKLDSEQELKIAHRLKDYMFEPNHFQKMNVSTAHSLLHNDTAAAIHYYVEKGKILNTTALSTAWFCQYIFKWFSLMSGRHSNLGLSLKNEKIYKETVDFLFEFMDVVRHIKVGVNWQPFQSGLLLATQTALDVHKEYLQQEEFHFVLLGRFTQDAIENLFSAVRSRTPVPGPNDFKTALRLITLSQYEARILHGNYFVDNREHLIKYSKLPDFQNAEEDEGADTFSFLTDSDAFEGGEITETEQITDSSEQSLYYLLGNILHSVKKSTCSICYDPLLNDKILSDQNCNNLALLCHLKSYRENVLVFPNLALFSYIKKAEIYYRRHKEKLFQNKVTYNILAENFLAENKFIMVKSCHNIIEKVVKLMLKTRFFFSLREINKENTPKISSNVKCSKSVAMRVLANNVK